VKYIKNLKSWAG